jgi:hypothetical protein
MKHKRILSETTYGEFGSDPSFTVASAFVDDSEIEGKNFVHIINDDHMIKLKKAYEKKEEDSNWLFHLFNKENEFPGYQEVNNFIEKYLDNINIFKNEDTWNKYFKFVLSNTEKSGIFRLDIAVDNKIEEKDLPIPFEYFRKMFYSIVKKMPKIIYIYQKEEPDTKKAAKPEVEKQKSEPVNAVQSVKNRIINAAK